ncbi:RNA 2',3'-cyclic phosphodiesterase [Ornithinimicrobium sp. W1665]|uniref:RNA 2',3'-cyclic phosphodiesterase n=1 Tax=Ornithinimicrobium sp. W1665 TaxID=3416666 RepID=UPI003CF4D50F
MRVFVAVVPPAPVVEAVEEFLQPRRDALATQGRWRWTRAEHLHLTLAFVPDLDAWREEKLIGAGAEYAARQRPLNLRLRRAGAFPDPGAARVLWAGVEEEHPDTLAGWAAGIRRVLSHAGARLEGTRFTPHVTLARSVGGRHPAGHLLQSLDTLLTPVWTVPELVLVASWLGEGPNGTPRHEVRHRWPLGREGTDG